MPRIYILNVDYSNYQAYRVPYTTRYAPLGSCYTPRAMRPLLKLRAQQFNLTRSGLMQVHFH